MPLALCKQEEDLGSEKAEEKVKEEEKDEEKEKARKDLARARKEKERAKARERKAKDNVSEGQFAVYVIKKDTGETNAPSAKCRSRSKSAGNSTQPTESRTVSKAECRGVWKHSTGHK